MTYLATGVGACCVASSAEASIVTIDLTNVQGNNIKGSNAGVAVGNKLTINDWLGTGSGRLEIYNTPVRYLGLDGDDRFSDTLQFAVFGSNSASPRNFAKNAFIDSFATWTGSAGKTVFQYFSTDSADFGAGSYMGFRFGSTGAYNYGYFEVTWTASSNTFQILSGAYESDANTAILAGAAGGGGSAVPEPASIAVFALLMGGTALRQWRKKRRETDTANSDSLAS